MAKCSNRCFSSYSDLNIYSDLTCAQEIAVCTLIREVWILEKKGAVWSPEVYKFLPGFGSDREPDSDICDSFMDLEFLSFMDTYCDTLNTFMWI